MNKWYKEKTYIESKIKEGSSYEELGREFGCSGSNIKKIALKLGIQLYPRRQINSNETFNKGIFTIPRNMGTCINCEKEFYWYKLNTNKYCCYDCQREHLHKLGYKKLVDGDPSIMRANYSPKSYKQDIIDEQNGVCAICGMPQEWNNKHLVFIIDHIDGDASNNKRDNLRCICPNCDSQLDTYKSKNKNGARSYYRYHKYKD